MIPNESVHPIPPCPVCGDDLVSGALYHAEWPLRHLALPIITANWHRSIKPPNTNIKTFKPAT